MFGKIQLKLAETQHKLLKKYGHTLPPTLYDQFNQQIPTEVKN